MKILIAAALLVCAAAFPQEPAGGSFEFVHNISGNKDDQVRSVAVGADGSIYVAGLTNSSDFVTTQQAARRTSASLAYYQAEAFVRKLSPDGTKIIYSTLLGQTRLDWPVSMGVDEAGNTYVAYEPELNATQPVQSLEPSGALVIVKLSPDGSRFLYRVSLLPEAFYGHPVGFVADKNGVVYIASGDSSFGIRRIGPSGSRIEAQTKVLCSDGGGLRVNALALGPDNSVYVAGRSDCRAFPATPNAYRSSTVNPQNGDAFVMRFDPSLARTIYATLLGGESADEAFALTIAEDGSATAGGQTAISTGLQPMPATPVRMPELKPNSAYGFAATLSPDGTSLKGAALFPSDTVTAVSSDSDGSIYVAGASYYSVMAAKVSPDLQTLRYIIDAPARNARISSAVLSNAKLLFGGSATTIGFPDNDPNSAGTFNGFAGLLRENPLTTDLRIEVQTLLTVPEVFGSYTTCRYVLTNRGENDAWNLLLQAGIEGASFQLWRADSPIFNVGPALAAVTRLRAAESATIEFLSNNIIFGGIRCSGRIYSATAEGDLSDNEASSLKAPQWIRVSINGPRGIQFRRDDWPVLIDPGYSLTATPNSQMRIYFPSPQKSFGQTLKFSRWSDGSSDNPRIFTVGEQDLSVTASFTTVPETTPLGTDPDGQPGALGPTAPVSETPLSMRPHEIATGRPEPVIVVNGTGLREGWEALWNGQPRPTEYLNPYQLRVTLQPEDIARPSLSWISVRDPERNVTVRARQAFWVYLARPNNDVLYDGTQSRLWVASPGSTGISQNEIVLIDPETGEVEQSLPLTAEPQKLALTDDARYLYIATPGRIYRLNTETLTMDRAFTIPATNTGSLTAEAYSMLAVPRHPDQVLVSLYAPLTSPGYHGTILFENGVPFARRLALRDGPALLYGWLDERTVIGGGEGDALYYAMIENGIELQRTLEGVLSYSLPGCLLEKGLLYCNTGAVLDAATGAYVRQYPARGAIGVAPDSDRVVFFGDKTQVYPSGALFGPMVTVRQSTSEFLSATPVPLGGSPGTVFRWGGHGLVYRPTGLTVRERRADKLYLFKLP